MSLIKQKISFPLTEGINTKIDPNQKPLGTMENLENVVFTKPGKISKRTGYDLVNTKLIDDTVIQDAQRLTTYKNELCMFNSTNLYSYSMSTDQWTNQGTVSNIFPRTRSIIRNTYEQSNIDSLHVLGLNIFAWEDSRNGIHVSIIDEATGSELLSDTKITSTGIKPKIEFIGNNIYFFYIDGTDIKYRKVNSIKPETIEAEVVAISSDVNATNKNYDAASSNDQIFIIWNSSAATLKTTTIFSDDSIETPIEDSGESPSGCIDLEVDPNGRLLISYYNGTDVKFLIKAFNLLANILAPQTVETIANIVNVTTNSTDGTTYTSYYEQSAASTQNHLIKQNTVTLFGVVGTPSIFIRSCGLAAKQFSHESNIYIPVLHNSALQSTLFILNSDAEVVSKINQNISGDLNTSGSLSKVFAISDTTYLISSQVKGRTVSENNILFTLKGVSRSILDFNSNTRFNNTELGDSLITNGGLIQSYDGNVIVEHGFNLFPENLLAGSTATTGGSISDGIYQYAAVYSWTDNRGQRHRSAPSIGLDVTLSGGTSTQTQTIAVPTLRITEKENVIIELYRTENAGTVFYKVTTDSSPTYNDKTVDTVNIVDTTADADLIDNEILYTTGGVLDNITPPSASIIESFGNRIFLAGLEEQNKIQYSKIRQERSAIEFNDSLILNVNPNGGDITSLKAMDDKLIIFKQNAIYYLAGNGPNNLGQQNNFIEPELITDDVGCTNPNSVVLSPLGIMFKSRKGIYLLDKTLSATYIGAAVEDFNSSTVTDATLVPTKNIVIFLTNENALVFDYFVNKWIAYTNHRGLSSTRLNDTYYYVRQNNEVYKEALHHTDAGSFIKMKLETSWISFAGVQHYQRVYRMSLLGNYKSPHKLVIKAAYNFKNAFIQEKVIDTSEFISDNKYGEISPYGQESLYGGDGNLYQIRLNMKKQKCQSIKITIEDSESSQNGESLEISNLLFVVGVKRGEFKMSKSNTYGTEG